MIITSAPTCYSSLRLIEEFQSIYGHSPRILDPKQLNSSKWLNLQVHDPVLIRFTGINYDDSDLFFAKTFRASFIQDIDEQLLFRDKLRQNIWFNENNIPTPPTEYNYDCSTQFKQGPFIAKTRRGMKGLGVTYLENVKSLNSFLKTLHSINDQQFLIQKYISATEYRYFIVQGKIIHVLKKDKKNTVIGNAGGQAQTTVVQEYPRKIVNQVIKLIKSHYYAIDLLLTEDDKELILEVNLAAGFEQLEKLTGDNIARRVWL